MADTTKVQVGEGGRKSKVPRWPFVAFLVLIVLVAAGFGAAARWSGVFFKESKPDLPTPLPAVIQDIQKLQLEGKTEESEQKVAELLANPDTGSADRYQLHIMQGDAAAQKGEFQVAVDAYAQAIKIKEDYQIATKLGAAWQGVGDKQKAIQYYNRAIELMPEDLPTRDSNKQRLEMSIKSLQE